MLRMDAPPQTKSKKLECKDLHGYIKSLPQNVIIKLYEHPACCLAIFRELPELAKHYILRVFLLDQSVNRSLALAWVNNQHSSESTKVMKVLSELCILQDTPTSSVQVFKLRDSFKKNLRIVLMGGGEPWMGRATTEPDKRAKDISHLDNYATERWECLLHYMVNSRDKATNITPDVTDVLTHAGFITLEEGSSEPSITALGFQFLLLDITSQVWLFVLKMLEVVESKDMDLVECLTFLFQLNFLTFGRDYTTEKLSEGQLKFLQLLRVVGLVYQRTRKAQRFYPTRLAINLTGNKSQEIKPDFHKQGFLVVDTMFRVTAYTTSSLQLNLLFLFSNLICRLGKMTTTIISRETCMKAFDMGITADQIISFLRFHTHPATLSEKHPIPMKVTDDIMLWELEKSRVKFAEGVLYNQFNSQLDFENVRNFAKNLDLLVWENPQNRVLVVARSGHDEVKKYWRRLKKDKD